MVKRPLTGIRVLDLSRVLAGPYCGQLLADMGADVIKVEQPTGDENRGWAPVLPSGESCNFMSVNRGKRGMTLNLRTDEGKQLLRKLLAVSDVLIHNYLPETAAKLGFDPDALIAEFPRLIVCSVTAYGSKGPLRDSPGYDSVIQAFAGIMAMTGESDGGPVRSTISVVDLATGQIACCGILSALIGRGIGSAERHVQVSLFESAVSLLGYHAVAYLEAGVLPKREGSGIWHLTPYQAFKCSDQYIYTGALNDSTWSRLCDCVGRPDLRDDPALASNILRLSQRERLVSEFTKIFATDTARGWLERLQKFQVPASLLHTLDQVFEHEQTLLNDMVAKAVTSSGDTVRLLGLPFKIGAITQPSPTAPPRLGQHTDEILQDLLGLDADQRRALTGSGAI